MHIEDSEKYRYACITFLIKHTYNDPKIGTVMLSCPYCNFN